MTLSRLCWLSTAACTLHIVEEAVFHWRAWVASLTGIQVSKAFFYTGNALGLVLAIAASALAATVPAFALALPAVMLINAAFFHLAPFVFTRGRFSPGLITAMLLFVPLGIACFHNASFNPSISTQDYLIAILIAIAFLASPIVFLKLFLRPVSRKPR